MFNQNIDSNGDYALMEFDAFMEYATKIDSKKMTTQITWTVELRALMIKHMIIG